MPAVKTSRPAPAVRQVLDESRRVAKHQNDNFDRLNQHWSLLQDSSTTDFTTFTHGVLKEVPNPFYPALPTGFQPLACYDATTGLTPQPTPVSWTFTPSQRDGWVGLTLYFPSPYGRISLRKSTNQTLTTGTTTAVTWDVIDSSGSLSLVSGSADVLCAEAGLVDVRFTVSFAINNVGQRRAYVTKNNVNAGSGDRKSHQAIPTNNPTTARATNTAGSALWEVAAGDSLQIRVFQDTGGNLDITGNGLDECQLDATYTAKNSTYSARVVGYLIGP